MLLIARICLQKKGLLTPIKGPQTLDNANTELTTLIDSTILALRGVFLYSLSSSYP